jgi:hypothetical protein
MITSDELGINALVARLDCTLPNFDVDYTKALNFIHYEIDTSQLKSELVQYAETVGRAAIALSIPANLIGVEGKIAFCLNRGAKLSAKSIDRIQTMLDNYRAVVEKEPEWDPIPETALGKNIQAYVACYAFLDNARARVLSGKLDLRQLAIETRKIVSNYANGKSAVVKMLVEHYTQSLVEARQDPCVKDWVKPLATISDTLMLLSTNKAAIKAGAKGAKARKMASTSDQVDRKGEKAATKVKYKDEDEKFGIISVDPTNIVGAEAVVVFNTKTRHCEIYRAQVNTRLSIQGARITNFDDSASVGKTIRQPEKELPHWTRATTIKRLEVLANAINGKTWEVSGKLNKNCTILKVL